MAERQPSKLHVAGSNPVSRSTSSFQARHLVMPHPLLRVAADEVAHLAGGTQAERRAIDHQSRQVIHLEGVRGRTLTKHLVSPRQALVARNACRRRALDNDARIRRRCGLDRWAQNQVCEDARHCEERRGRADSNRHAAQYPLTARLGGHRPRRDLAENPNPVARVMQERRPERRVVMDLLWIIIVVLVVLALLGYFGFGRRRG